MMYRRILLWSAIIAMAWILCGCSDSTIKNQPQSESEKEIVEQNVESGETAENVAEGILELKITEDEMVFNLPYYFTEMDISGYDTLYCGKIDLSVGYEDENIRYFPNMLRILIKTDTGMIDLKIEAILKTLGDSYTENRSQGENMELLRIPLVFDEAYVFIATAFSYEKEENGKLTGYLDFILLKK